jgi:histone-lysine N-methyltransferase SETMAR
LTTPEIIDQIHELILEDRLVSAKSIAETLGIPCEQVESIFHEDLDMRKLSAKWVPKCLKADQKRQRCQSSEQIWNFFGAIQIISCRARLVNVNETSLYHYDPETKQKSMEWRYKGSPGPKNFRMQKSSGNILASIFWNQDGTLLIGYLPKGQTINEGYYSFLL